MVGSLPDWPVDTVKCLGASGMTDCIQERAGTIGFLEAGRGVDAGLQEISIKNKYGRLINSQTAKANGGIGAREEGILPDDPSGDFGQVSLLNQDGEYTWPIQILSYILVRADLSFLPQPDQRSLLVAFLKALYDPSFTGDCTDKYGFSMADGSALQLGQKAIDTLEVRLEGSGANTWTFENKAEPIVGAGDYVLSANRDSYNQIETDFNRDQVDILKATVADLQQEIAALKSELSTGAGGNTDDQAEFTSTDETLILVALSMGGVALLVSLLLAATVIMTARGSATASDQEEK